MARFESMKDYEIIDLPKMTDARGNLSVIESGRQVPFDIKRAFYIYDVPGGESRAGHAHYELYQLVIAVSGSFTVELDDGEKKEYVLLNKPYQALLVYPGMWSYLRDFSSGAVALVLCSDFYDESDYMRDYDVYKEYRKNRKTNG